MSEWGPNEWTRFAMALVVGYYVARLTLRRYRYQIRYWWRRAWGTCVACGVNRADHGGDFAHVTAPGTCRWCRKRIAHGMNYASR